MEQNYRDLRTERNSYSEGERYPYQMDERQRVKRSPAEIERRRAAKKRRRRRIILRRILAVIILLAILGAAAAAVVFIKNRGISGTFTREADVSGRVISDMAIWLSDCNTSFGLEGDEREIDSEWIKERVESYTVTETLTLSNDGNSGGAYIRAIDGDSYSALTAKVNADIDKLLGEIIKEELIDKGYSDSLTEDEVSAIVYDALGMSCSEYLASNGAAIAPSLEELSKAVLGSDSGQSGTYSLSGNKMTVLVDGIESMETIIKRKDVLVFTESDRVYQCE